MFKTIVVGTDGSATADVAVRHAAGLAADWGSIVHLVCAYRARSVMLTGTPSGSVAAVALHTSLDLEVAARDVLDKAALELQAAGLVVHTHPCPGDPADAIIEVAEAQRADLIIVGSKGMTGPRRLLGSVPNRVSHHAPTSVLIVRTT